MFSFSSYYSRISFYILISISTRFLLCCAFHISNPFAYVYTSKFFLGLLTPDNDQYTYARVFTILERMAAVAAAALPVAPSTLSSAAVASPRCESKGGLAAAAEYGLRLQQGAAVAHAAGVASGALQPPRGVTLQVLFSLRIHCFFASQLLIFSSSLVLCFYGR